MITYGDYFTGGGVATAGFKDAGLTPVFGVEFDPERGAVVVLREIGAVHCREVFVMRRNAKVDTNQPEIVMALRAIGATVEPTHMIGRGFPDIVVGFRGLNYLLEIKDGDKVPSKRKLTDDETKWHKQWNGSVDIVESVEDAYQAIGAI